MQLLLMVSERTNNLKFSTNFQFVRKLYCIKISDKFEFTKIMTLYYFINCLLHALFPSLNVLTSTAFMIIAASGDTIQYTKWSMISALMLLSTESRRLVEMKGVKEAYKWIKLIFYDILL
jgi:hypothetical protein